MTTRPSSPSMGLLLSGLFLLLARTLADRSNVHNYHEYIQSGDAPSQTYKSANILAPTWNIDIWDAKDIDTEAPYIFLSLGDGNGGGPYIFSSKDLSLVYADRSYEASNNARVQTYRNETVFTFWEGEGTKGHAQGTCHMLNSKYEVLRSFNSIGLNARTDLHECELTKDGTALITVYETIPFDLSAIGGKKDDLLLDSVFQEIDIDTGELLFQWRGSDHISVTESYSPWENEPKMGWDAYHINSLEKDEHGDYYVSLRRLHSMIKVSGKDGHRIWSLGGQANNFTDLSDGHGTDFAWQHHMRFQNPERTELSLFDNHNLHGEKEVHCIGEPCSRGARLRLDYDQMSVKLLQNFYSPTGLLSYAMGGYDTTPKGNVLVSWGSQAEITEYTADGMPVMNVQFGKLGTWMRTYRVYKGHWTAYPNWPPDIAAESTEHGVRTFVSWNGATEVDTWLVCSSNDQDGPKDLLKTAPYVRRTKKGFETEIDYDGEDRFLRIVALDKNGVALGATGTLDIRTGSVMYLETPIEDIFYRESDGRLVAGKPGARPN